MEDVRAVGGFPPRNHFPMQVAVGPRPRAQQVRRLRGPSALPPTPAAKVAEKVGAGDDDDEVHFEVPRGGPSFSWTELMGDDAQFGFGTASDLRSRLDGLCKALFDGAGK
eukprot:3992300-Pyramimonas_sp.AAC.1